MSIQHSAEERRERVHDDQMDGNDHPHETHEGEVYQHESNGHSHDTPHDQHERQAHQIDNDEHHHTPPLLTTALPEAATESSELTPPPRLPSRDSSPRPNVHIIPPTEDTSDYIESSQTQPLFPPTRKSIPIAAFPAVDAAWTGLAIPQAERSKSRSTGGVGGVAGRRTKLKVEAQLALAQFGFVKRKEKRSREFVVGFEEEEDLEFESDGDANVETVGTIIPSSQTLPLPSLYGHGKSETRNVGTKLAGIPEPPMDPRLMRMGRRVMAAMVEASDGSPAPAPVPTSDDMDERRHDNHDAMDQDTTIRPVTSPRPTSKRRDIVRSSQTPERLQDLVRSSITPTYGEEFSDDYDDKCDLTSGSGSSLMTASQKRWWNELKEATE